MFSEAAFAAYSGLFVAAFLAATILPAQSELLLIALLVSGTYSVASLLVVATTGNVLGSVVNWTMGRFLVRFREARWFPVSDAAFKRAERWFERFGPVVLLLSWVPIVGDPLTVIAGVLRMRLLPFFIIVTIAKGGRYCVLAAASAGFAE